MKLQIQLSSCTRFRHFSFNDKLTKQKNKTNPETRKNDQRHNQKKLNTSQIHYTLVQIDGCDACTWLHQFNFWILMWIFIWFSRVIGMESPIAAATEGSAISYWRPVHHRPARTYPAQLPLFVNFLLWWSMWTTAWL